MARRRGRDGGVVLANLLRRDGDDSWMRVAVMSSLGGQQHRLLVPIGLEQLITPRELANLLAFI